MVSSYYDCDHTLSYLEEILGYASLSSNDLFAFLYLIDDQDCHYMYCHKTYPYYLLANGSHQMLEVDIHELCWYELSHEESATISD